MTEQRVTRVVTFHCQHVRIFEDDVCPRIGESLWCPKCREMVTVMQAPPEYRIRCTDCGYGKGYGRSRISAELGAAEHRHRKPLHVVALYDGKRLTCTYGNRDQIVICT